MKTDTAIRFTPLSGRKCVCQFVRVGVEVIGEPFILPKEVLEYLTLRDKNFDNLFQKREPFQLTLVLDERT